MSAGYDRTIGIIEHLGGGRAEEHSPESTRMGRQDDEIEACPRDLSDLCCRVSGNQDSWMVGKRKLSLEEGIEPVAADRLMFLRNLRRAPR